MRENKKEREREKAERETMKRKRGRENEREKDRDIYTIERAHQFLKLINCWIFPLYLSVCKNSFSETKNSND